MATPSSMYAASRKTASTDPRGYFTLLLHAHLPFVRHPRHARFLEENWFYEALTEAYLPLLVMLENLIQDGVDFRLSMSLTPPLVSMFDDDLLRDRYQQKLDKLIELCEKEIVRHKHHPTFLETATFYRTHYGRLRDAYLNRWQRDVTGAFRRIQDQGFLEILASPATHGHLPLLRHEPSSVHAQVRVGVDHYLKRFGRKPQGIWLPECAYYPGLDEVLAALGIRYFVLESHGVLNGRTRSRYGVHAPVVCPSGVAAFARDPECSKQVWSSREGFPGDPDYREFYWDIGYEMPLDYIGPYIGPDGIRVQTGIKYHRVTGRTENKEPYVRAQAMHRAAQHAGLFLEWRQKQVEWISGRMDRRPIILAPYDAELFGHWWFEGPEWITFLLRKMAFDQSTVRSATLSEYLAEYPQAQVSVPSGSSWGEKGFNEIWLNGKNDWIYPRLHKAGREMAKLASRNRGTSGMRRRVLNQAARELLLAQTSDWAFHLRGGNAPHYAAERTSSHLANFERLASSVRSDGAPSTGSEIVGARSSTQPPPEDTGIEALEAQNNIFPDLQFEVFEEKFPRPPFAILENPKHVVFLTAEAAPYVKVGGLADVAGALPAALSDQGVRVTVILPAYRQIDQQKHSARLLKDNLSVNLGSKAVPFRVLEASPPLPGVRVFFIDEASYFDRAGVYVDPKTQEEYPDTGERFVFFTKAALEALRALGDPVDIVHCHDHQTALGPAYLKINHRNDPVLGLAASVYTLHNLGYQGVYGPEVLDIAGFGRDQFYGGSVFEHYGKVNFMKLGIHFADKVNTVSEGYAREICEDRKIGAGLGDALLARGKDFIGILNGIDVDEWSPKKDRFLPRNYDSDDLAGKRDAKLELLRQMGLDLTRSDQPLVGMITRLVDQKGLDLVTESLGKIMEMGVSVVMLGTGLAKYESFVQEAATLYPGRFAVALKFDNALAHLIEAGSDIFLMPSLYEPCGLNQMYSLRYGTVPVVRQTGGLADTVTDDDTAPDGGTGFSFLPYRSEALVDAMERAVRAYRAPARWLQIIRRGMARNFSWGESAAKYVELYRGALARRS